jgi:hypothetical protein
MQELGSSLDVAWADTLTGRWPQEEAGEVLALPLPVVLASHLENYLLLVIAPGHRHRPMNFSEVVQSSQPTSVVYTLHILRQRVHLDA